MLKTLLDLVNHLVQRQKVLMQGDEMDKYAAAIIEEEVKKLSLEYKQTIDTLRFKLKAKNYDNTMITIADQTMTLTQLKNCIIIQPLAALTEDEMERLAEVLVKETKANENAPIILVPYDIRGFEVEGIYPTGDD